MDVASAISRFSIIGAALLAAYFGYRELTKVWEERERRQAYADGTVPKRQETCRRPPPQPADDCSICLEPFCSPIEILPCGHIFHKRCIRHWFGQRLICPVCKTPLNPQDRDEYRRRLCN